MNKPTFLVIKQANGLTEYINTNHILRVTHTKTHDSQALTTKLINGAILPYVIKNSETETILKQWIDFLEQQ